MSADEADQQRLPSVSVLVTSFNQKPILQRLLPQLLAEKYANGELEVVVVDGGSTDGTREWLATLHNQRMRPILQQANHSRSSSRNNGIRAAHNDVIIMLDGDHTVEENFILWHARRHTGRECIAVGESQFSRHWRHRALLRYLNTRGVHKLSPDESIPGRYFRTGNCSIQKSVLERLGPFDETITEWGGEDLELGVRAEEVGIPIVYEPRARAWHHHRRSLGALLRNLEAYGEKSIPHLLKKHPQLYTELNLHRLEKSWMCLLMTGAVYYPIRLLADLLSPIYVPPVVFDYLHLRQYGRGFLRSQKNKRKEGMDA